MQAFSCTKYQIIHSFYTFSVVRTVHKFFSQISYFSFELSPEISRFWSNS